MSSISENIRSIFVADAGWTEWAVCAVILAIVLAVTAATDLRLNWSARYRRAPAPERRKRLLNRNDVLSVLALVAALATVRWLPLIPPVAGWGWLVTVLALCVVANILLEIFAWLHRTVGRLAWRARCGLLLKLIATACAIAFIVTLPRHHLFERNLILMDLVLCGGLTIYREARRRVRAGDRVGISLVGSTIVVWQFLSLVTVVVMPLTFLVVVALSLSGLLSGAQGPQPSDTIIPRSTLLTGADFLWFPLFCVSALYLAVYLTRRITGARGFSWLDPPNWRTLLPHLKYHYSPGGRNLADLVRKAYLRAMVAGPDASDGDVLDALAAAAQIAPRHRGRPGFVGFAILGDPGEGDDSQVYPAGAPNEPDAQRGAAKQAPAQSIDQAADRGQHLDFMIISSDIVYPAGELMDYERCVYRPYRALDIPIYAIPGNHDWYDSLHGMLANFTYAAANSATPWAPRLRAMPWDWWPWRGEYWRTIHGLRRDHRQLALGGREDQPDGQQRLSFFEIVVPGDAPLAVLALDNGVSGSVDDLQWRWLERRLGELRAGPGGALRFIMVLVGNPLYVDGGFAGRRTAPPSPPPADRETYNMRALYEMLRRYRVDVVMGGDTHAYQRYEVSYRDEGGAWRTMHHIVNGGGGAFLSPPMDWGWIDFAPGLPLSQRTVYRNGAGADQVVLLDVFPTATEMTRKFKRPPDPAARGLRRWCEAYVTWLTRVALRYGFTNALDHDGPPLLQSYVTVELERDAAGCWELRIVPWLGSDGTTTQLIERRDRALVLRRCIR
jgi:hypothetical protein